MPIGFIFWFIMLLVILGKLAAWRGIGPPFIATLNEWILIILLFLLGWHDFGFIVHYS